MILPTIMALSLDALRSVPDELEEASYALGADKWETIRLVILPGASAGIITSLILGIMRAMGETMAVLMVLGQNSHFPGSIFDSGKVLTSKIVNDAGYWLLYPESKAALYGIAATLLLLEFAVIIIFRYISSKFVKRGRNGT